jgi:MFS transporter, YNFM family, putative membrane transport protein
MLASWVWVVVVGLALLTIGFFAAHTVASSWVGQRAEHGRAVASGLYLGAYYVGSSVGGTLGGVAYGVAGWPATVGFMVLLLVLAAITVWPLRPTASRA